MKALSKVCLGLLVVLAGTMGALNLAYAQTISNLTNPQTIEIVAVGTIAGLLLAYQNLPKGKPIVWKDFVDDVIHSAIVSVPIAITSALTQTDLSLFGLVLVFFASIGVTTTIQKARGTTVSVTPPTPT